MRPPGQLKHFGYAFLIAVVGYVVLYNLIERARIRRTPWEITFTQTNGTPALIVRQDQLAAESRTVIFRGANLASWAAQKPERILFDQARPVPFPVPFGQCIFLDTTFLPGTVVFELFGHTVEFMPRALIIDNQPHEWDSGFRELEIEPRLPAISGLVGHAY